MASPHDIPITSPSIICRLTDDGAVLVSPEAGDLRVLNAVGATIWQLVDGRRDIAALQDEMVRLYHISTEQAGADLQAFLADLERRHLLAWKDSAVS